MSNQYLKLRRSNIGGRIPTTGSIDFGEIALNTYDGVAYMKKSGSNGEEVVVIGSSTGSFTGNFTGTFTGSLQGTASFATSASHALSSSYALSASQAMSASYAVSSSQAISASYYNETDPVFTAVSGTFATTASFNAFTASYNTGSFTGSFSGSLYGTASWATNALTASSAPAYLPLTGGTINGNVTVNGTASIAFLNVTVESASVIYSSGSNIFGDSTQDTQTLIGTVLVSGSQSITGSLIVSEGITGSLLGTSSWAVNAITTSFVTSSNVFGPFGSNSVLSASYAVSSSQTVTASFASTASYLINAKEFYYTGSAPSGSFITTGSLWIDSDTGYMFAYIDDGSDKVWIQPTVEGEQGPIGLTGPQGPTGSSQPFSFVGNDTWATTSSLQVTGSLTVSGSSTFTNIGPAIFTGSLDVSGSGRFRNGLTVTGSAIVREDLSVISSNAGGQLRSINTGFNSQISLGNRGAGNTIYSTNAAETAFSSLLIFATSIDFNNASVSRLGNTTINGNLFTSGSVTVTGSQYFTGSSFINGNQSLTGNSTVTGSLNVIGNINVVSGSSFTRWGNKLFNYGVFSDTTTQTGAQNTILSMSFNTTDIGGAGVSVVDNTKITVGNTGIYNLQFSAQFDRTTSGTDTVTIWFAYTGSSIPNSATDVLISGNAANNPVVASWNYVLPMSASSYVEIYWSHDDNEANKVELKAVPARTGPVRPAVPSVIATLTQIA